MPNPELLCRAVAGIDSSIHTVDEFQLATDIKSRSVARSLLEFLAKAEVAELSGSTVSFSSSGRIKAAILCIKYGCDVREASVRLNWKDFEQLASEALRAFGYHTMTNVRLTKPRMEIDVVGILSSLALVVDCKHWNHSNRSSVASYARKQAARAYRFINYDKRAKRAVPVILTLQAESIKFVDMMPIVPVAQLHSFLQDMQAYLPEICVIGRS